MGRTEGSVPGGERHDYEDACQSDGEEGGGESPEGERELWQDRAGDDVEGERVPSEKGGDAGALGGDGDAKDVPVLLPSACSKGMMPTWGGAPPCACRQRRGPFLSLACQRDIRMAIATVVSKREAPMAGSRR